MSTLTHPLQHILERVMTDALEDHEGNVSIGGRTITNLRFADDIDGLAGEEEELAKLVERLHSLRNGGHNTSCLLYTSPSPRDCIVSRMPSSA